MRKLVLFLFLVLVAGCNMAPSKMIGAWRDIKDGAEYTFYNDGSYRMDMYALKETPFMTERGTYSVSGGKLKTVAVDIESKGETTHGERQPVEYEYEILADKMTLTRSPDGEVFELIKVESVR